jgi:hypothetical protein
VALEAAAAAIMPRISLAELAPKAQGPLQPGATSAAEAEPGRSSRFLAYDLLGCIISRDMGGHNSIEVGCGARGSGGWGLVTDASDGCA